MKSDFNYEYLNSGKIQYFRWQMVQSCTLIATCHLFVTMFGIFRTAHHYQYDVTDGILPPFLIVATYATVSQWVASLLV